MATDLERLFGITDKHTRPLMQQADMLLPDAPTGREIRGRIVYKREPFIKQRDLLDASFAFLLTFVGAMMFLI